MTVVGALPVDGLMQTFFFPSITNAAFRKIALSKVDVCTRWRTALSDKYAVINMTIRDSSFSDSIKLTSKTIDSGNYCLACACAEGV